MSKLKLLISVDMLCQSIHKAYWNYNNCNNETENHKSLTYKFIIFMVLKLKVSRDQIFYIKHDYYEIELLPEAVFEQHFVWPSQEVSKSWVSTHKSKDYHNYNFNEVKHPENAN